MEYCLTKQIHTRAENNKGIYFFKGQSVLLNKEKTSKQNHRDRNKNHTSKSNRKIPQHEEYI